MNEINCDIIKDLLPSYSDKISSNATNELVEKHLKECEKCKKILYNMNKEIEVKTLNNKNEQINYLKGFNKRKKIIVIVSIVVTIIILASIFMINVLNKNILLDKSLYVDVNKFNIEYMYITENKDGIEPLSDESKMLKVYLYSDEYDKDKHIYLTGGYELEEGEKEIYYKISAKELPKGIEFDSSGIEISFRINDNIEKIYIEDSKHNRKEIWNKDTKVQTEEEWKKWYIDSYVPEEIKDLYNMNYDNIPVDTPTWKNLYNKNLENSKNVKVWGIKE